MSAPSPAIVCQRQTTSYITGGFSAFLTEAGGGALFFFGGAAA